MLIERRRLSPNDLRELRVLVPVRHHIRLQSMKLLEGVTMGSIVADALDRYFAELEEAARHGA